MACDYEPECGPPDDEDDTDSEADDDIITCWCGARGPYEDLFDDVLDETCGGSGVLNCYCGGDFCVCHNHGETECIGCEDCTTDEETGFEEDDYSDRY